MSVAVEHVSSGANGTVASVRLMRDGDRAHILRSWQESYKNSPSMKRKLWKDYKQIDVPLLREALDRRDTTVLVAANENNWPVGWMAFAKWPSIDTVHWIHTSIAERRRGVMRKLIAAADLKPRIVYTHLAEIPHSKHVTERNDQWLSRWLAARGHFVSYTPYQEWAR